MTPRDAAALRILRDALDVDDAARAALVAARCGADDALRERVETLLRHAAAVESETTLQDEAATHAADIDTLIGTQLGPFHVMERIGRGGMGVVYRGERTRDDFQQQVALKLIRRGFDFDDVHARFLRERRILARLSHPNIARLIDGGVAPDGRPWFALEFVQGTTITRWCDLRRLDVQQRVRLFLQVCAAVQHAHTQLIVHLDLKPGNVLVDDQGEARLLDFGIARLVGADEMQAATTVFGRSALTPEYAAPEQFGNGDAVGVASDVYSLGVILYELIAGVGPYPVARNDLAATAASVRETLPESLSTAIALRPRGSDGGDAPLHDTQVRAERLRQRQTSDRTYRAIARGDLARIVGKALAKEPERRYATVAAFAEDLSRWLAGKPVRIVGNGLGYRVGKFIGRHRSAVMVAGVLALGLAVSTAVAFRSAYVATQQREAALAEAARVAAVREYVLIMFRDAAQQPESGTQTARDALARGAEQIFEQFRDRPDVGQATALSLSELYMQLGDVAGGAPLLERLIAWPGIENNPDVLASARYNLAQMEYARGDAKRARALLDAAQAWWSAEPARHRAQLAESRSTQAQIERAEGRVDEAIATLEQAVAERRATPDNARGTGAALNALALALAQAGRYEESAQRADEAVALFADTGASGNVIALAALNNRASARMSLKNYDAAIVDFRRAIELRRDLYGRSPELAGSQINLAMALLRRADEDGAAARDAQIDESIALIEDAYAMAREGSGDNGRIVAMARVYLAETYVLRGRVAEAETLAEDAVAIGREQFGADSTFAGTGLRARATVRAAQGRRDEARADLDAAEAIFVGMGKGGETSLASLQRIREQLDGANVE